MIPQPRTYQRAASTFGRTWRDPIYGRTRPVRVTEYAFDCPGCGLTCGFGATGGKPRDCRYRCHGCGRRYLLNPRKR